MGAMINKRFRRIFLAEKAIKERGRKHLTEQEMENFYAGKIKFPESIALLAHLRSCRKCYENFFAMLIEKGSPEKYREKNKKITCGKGGES